MPLTDAQHDYVDRVATYFASLGSSRAWAEILAWMIICEPAEQSQASLAADLGLSAGSVSTQVRSLVEIRLVEPVRRRGERTQYYRLRPGAWRQLLESELQRIEVLKSFAHAAEAVMPRQRPDRVTEMGAVAAFFEREWPPLMRRLAAELKEGTP